MNFDVIIIGGSYAGLSAAMSLGRALRSVLIIDSGNPCNRQTPHSHNFLTQDGKTPQEIADSAKTQVLKYKTIKWLNDFATDAVKTNDGFGISTAQNKTYNAKKLIIATGIKDLMPAINGFDKCWGISVIHCPYCHGYEYKNEPTGILGNGEYAFEMSKMISNWTKNLTVFTNGTSGLTDEQLAKLKKNKIELVEKEIDNLSHDNGYIKEIVFKDQSVFKLKALYAKVDFEQHSAIPANLGCDFTEQGHLKVDQFQKTSVKGVFACGDNSTFGRAVAIAVAQGTVAGSMCNKEIIEDEF